MKTVATLDIPTVSNQALSENSSPAIPFALASSMLVYSKEELWRQAGTRGELILFQSKSHDTVADQ
jgi:hypothetical protein